MAKNKNRVRHQHSDSAKTAPTEQTRSGTDQTENTQGIGAKPERKRQTKKFGHN